MVAVETTAPDPAAVALAREELHAKLTAGAISIEAFSRAWRGFDRPATVATMPPDELRLRRARKLLGDRGERHCRATSDLPITMRLAEPPEPSDWLRSA